MAIFIKKLLQLGIKVFIGGKQKNFFQKQRDSNVINSKILKKLKTGECTVPHFENFLPHPVGDQERKHDFVVTRCFLVLPFSLLALRLLQTYLSKANQRVLKPGSSPAEHDGWWQYGVTYIFKSTSLLFILIT